MSLLQNLIKENIRLLVKTKTNLYSWFIGGEQKSGSTISYTVELSAVDSKAKGVFKALFIEDRTQDFTGSEMSFKTRSF